MEKLKYIKIEHEDGTLSNNVPIGADAENIDTANGHSTLAEDLSSINASLTQKDTRISNLETHYGNLSTGSPLIANNINEMIDTTRLYINTEDNNWYYYSDSAWHVGGKYNDENSLSIYDLYKILPRENEQTISDYIFQISDMEQGGYLMGKRVNPPASNRIRVGRPVELNLGTSVTFECNSNYRFLIHFMNDETEESYAGAYYGQNITKTFTAQYPYCRVMVCKADGSDIEPEDIVEANLVLSGTMKKFAELVTKTEYDATIDNFVDKETFNSKLPLKESEESSIKVFTEDEYEQGGYSFGQKTENAKRVRIKDAIPLTVGSSYILEVGGGYSCVAHFMEDTTESSYAGSYIGFNQILHFTADAPYMRVAIKKDNNDNIIPSEAEYIALMLTGKIYVEDDIAGKAYVNEKIDNISTGMSRWKDAKINFLGDSITAPSSSWIKYCAERLNAAVYRNYGISLSTIANQTDASIYNPMCLRYTDMDDDADLIVVLGGRNDYRAAGTPIGEKGSIDDKTFYGAVEKLVSGLQNKYPLKTIVFCTMYHARVATDPEQKDNEWLNSVDKYQDDYNEVIREICKDYAIPVIDLYYSGCFNLWNDTARTTWGNDTVHLTTAGHKALGAVVASRLNNI